MKKILLLLLSVLTSLVLYLGITGCNCSVPDNSGDNIIKQIKNDFGAMLEGTNIEDLQFITEALGVDSEARQEVLDILEESGVELDDKALAVLDLALLSDGVKVQPDGTVKVTIPAFLEDITDYDVYHMLEDGKVEELVAEYSEGKIIFETDSFSYFVITTANVFNATQYYRQHTFQNVHEWVTVGEDYSVEDAYEIEQPRTLKVGTYIEGRENVDVPIRINGMLANEYFALGEPLAFGSLLNLYAPIQAQGMQFAGWYEAEEVAEDGNVILKETPFAEAPHLDMKMLARDLTLYAVYAKPYTFSITAQNGMISVDGGDMTDIASIVACYTANVYLYAEANDGYRFSHWAFESNLESAISEEVYFYYVAKNFSENLVAVFEEIPTYAFSAYSTLDATGATDEDDWRYHFNVNGEAYGDDYYSDTIEVGYSVTLEAVAKKNCQFLGWYAFDDTTESFEAGIGELISTDAIYTFVAEEDMAVIAQYKLLTPQRELKIETHVDNPTAENYMTAFIVEGEYRGDNFYYDRLAEGCSVTVRAVPELYCRFEGWYTATIVDKVTHFEYEFGALISDKAEYTFTMGKEDMLVVAKFVTVPTSRVEIQVEEGGTLYIDEANVVAPYVESLEAGGSLNVKVEEAKAGFKFIGWYAIDVTGAETLYSQDKEITISVGESGKDVTYIAKFEEVELFEIKFYVQKGGEITWTDYVMEHPEDARWYYFISKPIGDQMELSARVVDDGYEFVGWEVNGPMVSRALDYTLTVEGATTVRAIFREKIEKFYVKPYSSVENVQFIYDSKYGSKDADIIGVRVPVGYSWEDNTLFLGLFKVFGKNATNDMIIINQESDYYVEEWLGGDIAQGKALDKIGIYKVTLVYSVNTDVRLTFTIQVEGTDETGTYVWVPRTGSKYHLYSDCSSMQNPAFMTKEDAIANGYEACKICYGG